MIIRKIKLHNIRSYQDQEIELGEGITLFEGDIGSGKTTILMSIDFALFDIISQKAGLPLKDLLGGRKDRIETSLTVDIGNLEYTLKNARKLLDAGAKVLKVKIGLNPQEDIERIKAIRDITDAKIRVDGNQGYSLKRAIRVLREMEKYELEFAEQPIPANEIENLKILRESVDIPLIADESVHNSFDVMKLIGKVDGINIKLMKSGGIYEAIKMASIARAAGMKIMVGCMIETQVGIAAGTHFALGIGVDYADLDGYWDLTEQPYKGVEFKDGYNYVSEKSGLGIEPQ
jgi:L-alanine-DL-glutamate epimerase-like enolase superfamily enzyme